jgi:hypothetical protein
MYLYNSSSFSLLEISLETKIFLLNALTKFKSWIELYTIDPTELYTMYVDIKQLKVNNFTSLYAYFDNASLP